MSGESQQIENFRESFSSDLLAPERDLVDGVNDLISYVLSDLHTIVDQEDTLSDLIAEVRAVTKFPETAKKYVHEVADAFEKRFPKKPSEVDFGAWAAFRLIHAFYDSFDEPVLAAGYAANYLCKVGHHMKQEDERRRSSAIPSADDSSDRLQTYLQWFVDKHADTRTSYLDSHFTRTQPGSILCYMLMRDACQLEKDISAIFEQEVLDKKDGQFDIQPFADDYLGANNPFAETDMLYEGLRKAKVNQTFKTLVRDCIRDIVSHLSVPRLLTAYSLSKTKIWESIGGDTMFDATRGDSIYATSNKLGKYVPDRQGYYLRLAFGHDAHSFLEKRKRVYQKHGDPWRVEAFYGKRQEKTRSGIMNQDMALKRQLGII